MVKLDRNSPLGLLHQLLQIVCADPRRHRLSLNVESLGVKRHVTRFKVRDARLQFVDHSRVGGELFNQQQPMQAENAIEQQDNV